MFKSTITKKDLAIFQELSSQEHYLKDEIIFNTLASALKLYVIAEGQVKLVTSTEVGNEIILAVRTSDDLIGEAFFQGNSEYAMDAIALVDTTIHSMDQSQYLDLIQQAPSFSLLFSGLLSSYLFRTWERGLTAPKSVKIRLANLFIEQAKMDSQKLPNGYIKLGINLSYENLASMINTTRIPVSKIMTQFKKSGVVTKEDGSYILDIKKLKAFIP